MPLRQREGLGLRMILRDLLLAAVVADLAAGFSVTPSIGKRGGEVGGRFVLSPGARSPPPLAGPLAAERHLCGRSHGVGGGGGRVSTASGVQLFVGQRVIGVAEGPETGARHVGEEGERIDLLFEGGEGGIEEEGEGVVQMLVNSVTPVKEGEADGTALLNLALLLAAGGWALHVFTTVDANLWRGWTPAEIIMRLPYDNWDSYEERLTMNPILTKTAINVFTYLVGDWMAQVNWGRSEDQSLLDFDMQRTLRNGLMALLFGPITHYYYMFSDSILPVDILINKPLKILMDQSGYFAAKCGSYIFLSSLLRGEGTEAAFAQVKERLWKVLTTGWKFWPLVHILTYTIIPARERVLWVSSVDLVWSSILSSLALNAAKDEGSNDDSSGSSEEESDSQEEEVAAVAATAAPAPGAAAAPAVGSEQVK